MELNCLNNFNSSECLIRRNTLCSKQSCLTKYGLHDQFCVHSISDVNNLIAVNVNNDEDIKNMTYKKMKNDESKCHHDNHERKWKTSMETEFSSPSSPCDETENWDISDDSTDEYDPNVCKEPRIKRTYLPFGIYGKPGSIFCPADLHNPSIKEQLYQMQQNSAQDCYSKIEEGQFDDA